MKLPLISALIGVSAMVSVVMAAPAEDQSNFKDATKQPMVLPGAQMDLITAGGEDGIIAIRLIGLNPAGHVVPTEHALEGKAIEPLFIYH